MPPGASSLPQYTSTFLYNCILSVLSEQQRPGRYINRGLVDLRAELELELEPAIATVVLVQQGDLHGPMSLLLDAGFYSRSLVSCSYIDIAGEVSGFGFDFGFVM